ncbi:MAG: S41 family peptidase [Cytophagaceae bacterium]|jgi:carboxyl-terminal processing protease|nr:S41 family peptidase [Cytophagaceae bacterium]
MSKRKIILWSISVFTLLGAVSAVTADRYFEIAKNIEIFTSVFKEANLLYVDEVNPSKTMQAGIDAMLESLDPYTNYIPEDDIEDFRTQLTGQYGGIGAVIGERNGKIVIMMPYENFPAHKGGLLIGDEILSVDGVETKGKNTSDVSKLLRGQAETPVKVKVKRFNQKDPIEVTLTRQKIKINNVPYYGMVDTKTAYIKLSDFSQDASGEIRRALVELKGKGAQQLILDLRGNPGGLLDEAVKISNIFIDRGKLVVSTKGKVAEWNKEYKTNDLPDDLSIPVVVLVNGRSASASEIVSGTLQDYDRAVVIGQRSFGKGLVQTIRDMPYNSQMKVTTAKYYTPSGRCIQSIDYAHKNKDGSGAKIADSLYKEFKTKNGRTVTDGGGVLPDIITTIDSIAPITISLMTKSLLFDYATEYYYSHPSIGDAKSFNLTDAEYDAFVAWLKGKDYNYTTKVDKEIEDIIKQAKQEKYYDAMKTDIEHLKSVLAKDKENDLIKFKDQIREFLEEEIASRYYLQKGIIESGFDHDKEVIEAIKVLNDTKKYQSVLMIK